MWIVTVAALTPGSKGATMPPVWDAVGCKPQGLPEVAAVEVVGSGACLSILPCSHRPLRDIHEVIWADQCRRPESNMMGVEGR